MAMMSAAAFLILAAGSASAQFVDMAGLSAQLAEVRTRAAAQKSLSRGHRMGGDRGFSAQSLPPASAPLPAAVPDVSAYPVRGMDVSHYEGVIDWDLVKTAGLSFVYIKATDGVDLVDEQFAANWRGAAKAGLARGAYHFYDFCKSGSAQAAHFTETVPADADTLPPTIDLEQSKECAKMPAKAAFRKSLAAFVAKVRAVYHREPVLYINASIYAQYLQGENDPYKLWIADVKHAAPQIPGGPAWAFWQYGWHGKVPGIANGEVDLDVFNGTPEMLAALDAAPGGFSGVMFASR